MTENNREGHWLFIVRTVDKPGAAASIAVAFSGRGIQIESFIGYGDVNYHEKRSEGIIAITFMAFERRMELVRNVLQRLQLVRDVRAYDYENDASLVKSATVCAEGTPDEIESLMKGAPVEWRLAGSNRKTIGLILYGRPVEVDKAVKKLTDAGKLISSVYTILPNGI